MLSRSLRITKKRSKKPKRLKKISRAPMQSLPNSMRSKVNLTKKQRRKRLSTQLNLLRKSRLLNKKMKSMLSPRRLMMQLLVKRPPKKPRKLLQKNLRKPQRLK